jgi:dephospho-CoA kinase
MRSAPGRDEDGTTGPPPAGAREAARPLVIGLLGGVASGKSAVAAMLAERGARVLDADRLAHAELAREEIRDRVVAALGPEVLDASGRAIDRSALGRRVFGDRAALARLEAIVHPGVLAAIERELEAGRPGATGRQPVLVLDVPLLAEAGVLGRCREVLFVEAPRAVREARARSRGWAAGELERREAHQAPLEEKRARATFVVRNDGDLAETSAQVARFWAERVEPWLEA